MVGISDGFANMPSHNHKDAVDPVAFAMVNMHCQKFDFFNDDLDESGCLTPNVKEATNHGEGRLTTCKAAGIW